MANLALLRDYPRTDPNIRPTRWWHIGWVLYANRATVLGATAAVGLACALAFGLGAALGLGWLVALSLGLALLASLLLANALIGLNRIYGPPAVAYVGRLLEMAGIAAGAPERLRVADLHIGTYRVSYLLADLLPAAQIKAIDIWDGGRFETEGALALLRRLEQAPAAEPRIRPMAATNGATPLPDASCDLVVLGMGLHEVPAGAPRDELFAEARRLLKPGGACCLFEHTVDLQSLLIFGPEIHHWVRREEWRAELERVFGQPARHERSGHAVDLFCVRKAG